MAFYFYMSLKEYWPKWKRLAFALLPITGLTGMFSSSNRGTLVGGAAVVIWMFLKSKYKVKALCALALVGFLAFHFVPEEQKKRFDSAGKDQTSVTRLDNWKKGLKMAEMNPVFGVGYKNWQVADRQYFDGNGFLPHNIFVECMSELGYSGLAVFICLILVTLTNNAKTRKLVMINTTIENRFIYNMAHALDASLIGYLVSGFFVTVLYYPYFWINLSLTVALNNVAKSGQFNQTT
jgi:O-antigen ligase